MGESHGTLAGATHLLVVGTSLAGAPACHIPDLAAQEGARVEILDEDAAREVPRPRSNACVRKGSFR